MRDWLTALRRLRSRGLDWSKVDRHVDRHVDALAALAALPSLDEWDLSKSRSMNVEPLERATRLTRLMLDECYLLGGESVRLSTVVQLA